MRIPILLLLIQCALFAEVPKEFYAKANGQYYTFTSEVHENYVCEVEAATLLCLKQILTELSSYIPSLPAKYEPSFVQKGSNDVALFLMTKGSLTSLEGKKIKAKVLKKERQIFQEVEGFNKTAVWFLTSPMIFDIDSAVVDSLVLKDGGFIYKPAYNKGYEIHLDKEYRITHWSNTVQTKKGAIFTKISPSFQEYGNKWLLSGYFVDVAHGKMTSDVSIEYDFSREYPLFKTISINTALRGKSYPLKLLFSNYQTIR